MRILHHTFISSRRPRSASEVPHERAVAALADTGVGESPDARLDLVAALVELSRLDRSPVVARYVHQMDVREVARLLGMSESNVRTRARRALHRLRPLVEVVDTHHHALHGRGAVVSQERNP